MALDNAFCLETEVRQMWHTLKHPSAVHWVLKISFVKQKVFSAAYTFRTGNVILKKKIFKKIKFIVEYGS